MNNFLISIVSVAFLLQSVHTSAIVRVYKQDKTSFKTSCMKNSEKQGDYCVCSTNHSTILSENMKDFACFAPSDIDCNCKVGTSLQTHMVERSKIEENDLQLNISLNGGALPNDDAIEKVSICFLCC